MQGGACSSPINFSNQPQIIGWPYSWDFGNPGGGVFQGKNRAIPVSCFNVRQVPTPPLNPKDEQVGTNLLSLLISFAILITVCRWEQISRDLLFSFFILSVFGS